MTLKNLNSLNLKDLNSNFDFKEFEQAATRARINALTMVQGANSGHPAGAFSSIEILLSLYALANLTPENANDFNRDNIIISHGHVSAAAYAVLGEFGFIDVSDAVKNFRRCYSAFQGHVVREVPGIDWSTGNLGQGLSAGVGYALAQRARNYEGHVYVFMGDGAQTKGQLAEARRVAIKENLKNITALIDFNEHQICGDIKDVMPCNIKALWEADGWEYLECNGHDFKELFATIIKARDSEKPCVIACKTVMGKSGCAMENTSEYHGKAPGEKNYYEIIKTLGGDENLLSQVLEWRKKNLTPEYKGRDVKPITPVLKFGERFKYSPDTKTDNRSAFGKVLTQTGELNYKQPDKTPILVFDCDLAPSVMTANFKKSCPDNFIQCGIQEHTTATISGAAAAGGVLSVWADFGMFGLDEAYNQHRLNDINFAGNKLVLTHVGLDVGEDGSTHQCIDYVALINNMFGWKILVPADPNQTDQITRWMLKNPGCMCLAMGRSKVDAIPEFYNDNYEFNYGEAKKLRSGSDGSIFALGYMTQTALNAADELAKQNIFISVYCISCTLEIDLKALNNAVNTNFIMTLEDHNVNTGLGSIIANGIVTNNLHVKKFKALGVSHYGLSGASNEVRKCMGLSVEGVIDNVNELLRK